MIGISKGLARGNTIFLAYAPGIPQILRPKYLKVFSGLTPLITCGIRLFKGDELSDILGGAIGNATLGRLGRSRLKQRYIETLKIPQSRHRGIFPGLHGLGAQYRDFIRTFDANQNGRVIKPIRVIYHDADRARKHLDIHIGHQSMVVRVSGKPVEDQLKFRNGVLTEDSKKLLITHLRSEIENNSRVVHNHDHTVTNSKSSWYEKTSGHYGAGVTRQLVLEDKAELYHPHLSTQHWYIPSLFPNQGTYLYQIYKGDKKSAPILIWGKLIPRDEPFRDRLHLKMIQPEEFTSKYLDKIDLTTNTRKYDGASTYFTTNGIGFKFFSPRFSKVTGHRIEYTYKIPELAAKGHNSSCNGIGELLFWRRTIFGQILKTTFNIRGIENWCWSYLSAPEIGGILNSNSIRPTDIYPEVRVYRIDKWFGKDTYDIPFHMNRKIQTQLINNLKNEYFKIVSLTRAKKTNVTNSWEGFVGIPKGLSVNDGYKIKWWQNSNDWEVTNVGIGLSDKGNIKGVVTFKSLESGKYFNLGPGQIGSYEQCIDILQNEDNYINRVAKVTSRNGFEGRSAKIVEWHLDK